MAFESIVFLVDNSHYMINGDHPPSRKLSQSEAINKLASSKISKSPENSVGLIYMAGQRSEVAVSNTRELGEVMRSLHSMPLHGQCDLISSLKVARLVLKNRVNKSQKQRVILFVGSPVDRSEKELIRIGKILKKNGIAIDLVHFGSENATNGNTEKLGKLVSSAKSGDNSRFVDFSAKGILGDSSNLAAEVHRALGGGEEQAVEAGNDPELAMALQMSLADFKDTAESKKNADEKTKSPKKADEFDTEDISRAIAMSMGTAATEEPKKVQISAEKEVIDTKKMEEILQNQEFLNDLIDSLPDVDRSSIDLDKVVAEVFDKDDKREADTDEEEEGDKKKSKKNEQEKKD